MSETNEVNRPDKIIVQAVSVLQTAFGEAALLFKDFDEMMESKDWHTAYGNRTTKEVTSNLNDPLHWLLQCSFRIYESSEKKQQGLQTRLGISIVWWNDIVPGQEPTFIMARIDAHPTEFDHWDVWYAWEDTNFAVSEGKPVTKWKEDWGYTVSARPLTDIQSKEVLKKHYEELMTYLEMEIYQEK
jgi:hypothetical protein